MSISQSVMNSIRRFAEQNKKGKIRVYFTDKTFKDYSASELNNLSTKEWFELGNKIGLYDNLRVLQLGNEEVIFATPNNLVAIQDLMNVIIKSQELFFSEISNKSDSETKLGVELARRGYR